MSSKRQPKLGIGLRICAVFSLFAWLAVSSHCATEFLFGHSHDGAGHEHADADHHEHDADASSHATSGHSHDSGDDEKDHSCCSTLQTITPSASSFVFLKPDFGKLFSLQIALLTQALYLADPEVSPPRQAKYREWLFTPEVYLGPAFRAHAPPLFI